MIELDEVYPMVFYGGSAVFAVMAIAFLGFDYLQDLSKLTIAFTIFAIFAASFLIATTRETLMKTVFYLVSAGSYLLFLVYVIGRFSRGTGDTIIFFLISAGLFSGIGHLLTSRPELIPDKDKVKKILIVITVLTALLIIYNIAFVTMSFTVSLEDTVTFNETEQKIGEIQITKKGYLPLEASEAYIDYCVAGSERDLPTRYRSVGDKSFGILPETYTEDITFELDEGFLEHNEETEGRERINITRNTVLQVVEVDECSSENLSEGQLGVSIDDDWR